MKMRKCSFESTRSRYNTVIMTRFLHRFHTPCEIFWQLMRNGCVYRVGREQYHWVPYIFSKLGTPRYNLWEFVFLLHILAFCMNCFWSPHQFPNSSVFKISRNTSLFSLVTPWLRYKTFGLFSSSFLKSSFRSSSLLAVPVFLSCGGGGSKQQRWEGNQDRRLKMVNIRKLKKKLNNNNKCK